MASIQFDHVGVVVHDLEVTARFFVDLGFHREGPIEVNGYSHIAYRVTNIDAVVAQTRAAGYRTVGDVVDYQDSYRLTYLRGPEGLIVEVAEPLRSASTSD